MQKCINCSNDLNSLFVYCPTCGMKQIERETQLLSKQLQQIKGNNVKQDTPAVIVDNRYGLQSGQPVDENNLNQPQPINQERSVIIDIKEKKPEINEDENGIFPRNPNLINNNSATTLCTEFRGQAHYRPSKNAQYWMVDKLQPKPNVAEEKVKKKVITILVPFYNEEASDLFITLDSLYNNFASLKRYGFELYILLVMDGWWKASESMKDKMKAMFPANDNSKPWWEFIQPIDENADMAKQVGTFIVQRTTPDGAMAEVEFKDGLKAKISLVAKRDNRKKINAHDWMLTSFAKHYESEFVFLTDCGTLFAEDCLTLLVKELLRRPECVAVTGRQRVMNTEQQQVEDESCWSFKGIFRAAQQYDYESSLASYVGAFSLFGMLPVIPGPCGLYRYKDIRAEAVPFYLDSVAAHPSECGMLLANLNLAEDRVLSYAAVVKTHDKAYTCYVPSAVFYFAAETEPLQFFQQRRRWINGTMAGYVWLLSSPEIILKSGLRTCNKPFLFLLLFCQAIMYLMMLISPAIFLSTFYWSTQWVQNYLQESNNNFLVNNLASLVLGFYVIIYIIFVIKHSSFNIKPPVISWMVYLIALLNAFAMMCILASMFYGFKSLHDEGKLTWFAHGKVTIFDIVILLILSSMAGPALIAILHSPTSFYYMITSIFQFYLFLPTMVAYVGAFAISRTWDLSWGNRPTVESSLQGSLSIHHRRKINEDIRKKGKQIAYASLVINLAIIASTLMLTSYRDNSVVVLAFLIFSWGAIQMIFSIIYFLLRIVRLILRNLSKFCCVTVLRVKTKTEWYNDN